MAVMSSRPKKARMRKGLDVVSIERLLHCPVCGWGHKCVKPRYMYKSSHWIGYICMLYCESEGQTFPVYKLYDEQYHYVGYTSHLWPTWDFSHEDIPF